ncbi:MAG: ferritin-like domain-containing protein [Phycisphaerales bacterium]
MNLKDLDSVYLDQLKDIHSVEKQLTAALPRLGEAAENSDLKEAFTKHLGETQEHLRLIEALLTGMSTAVGKKKCKGIAGIIAEADEVSKASGDGASKDAALIAAAQRAEHYEIAAYGTAAALARKLGKSNDQAVLDRILEEEKQVDRTLSRLATGEVNPLAHESETAAGAAAGSTVHRRLSMGNRRDYDDYDSGGRGGYEGRSEGGRRSSSMQERDEYGQFTGSGGGGSRYRSENDGGYGGDGRYRSDNYGGGRGGYEGRSEGGYRSSSMQDRDEYGQFAGYRGGGGSRSRYEDDDDRGSYGSSSRGTSQYRDRGGNDGGSYGGGRGDYSDSAGRQYSRESWERAQEGRSLGGQHSHGGRSSRGDYDDSDYGGGGGRSFSSRSSRYSSDDGDYMDSAGRHYSRESWERAQEGRSLGGQHSHGGRR